MEYSAEYLRTLNPLEVLMLVEHRPTPVKKYTDVVFVTTNTAKLTMAKSVLGPTGVNPLSISENEMIARYYMPEEIQTDEGLPFELQQLSVAEQVARQTQEYIKRPVLASDYGLYILLGTVFQDPT